ncbi:MAG: signal peptidase I [Lachnospiraceae bacterium]|nr:signal peptidase I [Lachnospiraceae bacterium]
MAKKKKRRGLTFYEKENKVKPGIWKEVFNYAFYIVTVILIAFVLVFLFGMRVSTIGVSMEPTLTHGQEVFVNRISYLMFQPKVGDVVVFRPNGNEKSHYYIKRVVATPGDTVQVKNGTLYVNNEEVTVFDYDKIENAGLAENAYLLGEKEFFVMGDNCNNSEDSRSGNIGSVHRDDIVGRAWFRFAKENIPLGLID